MKLKFFEEQDLVACTATFMEVFNDAPWHDEWTFERAQQYLADFYHTPGFWGLLAMENQAIIGFVYGVKKAWWSGDEFYIHEIGVKKEWQQKGIGRKLLDELVKEMKPRGVSNLALLTDRGTPAEGFYQKNEFKAIERLVFYSRDL